MGSGHAVTIEEVLKLILSLSEKEIRVEVDANKIRPADVPVIEADIGKICQTSGWTPEITLEQTIRETLDYWRERV